MFKAEFETSKRRALLTSASAIAALVVLSLGAGGAAAATCESLAGKTFGDATITAATAVTPPFSVMGKDPPAPVSVNASFCRVQGAIKPTSDSDIRFEVWLPPSAAWNGKYEGVGNGGFAGSVIYSPMSWALEAGYAVVRNRHRPFRRVARFAPGLSAIPKRSSTSVGVASTRPPRRRRRSSRPIMRRPPPTRISVAAPTAVGRR